MSNFPISGKNVTLTAFGQTLHFESMASDGNETHLFDQIESLPLRRDEANWQRVIRENAKREGIKFG